MEPTDIKDEEKEPKKPRDERNPYIKHTQVWRIMFGLFILLVGVGLFTQQMYPFFPAWLFTWPVLLIALGLGIGIKTGFRRFGAFFLIVIGGLFLAQEAFKGFEVEKFIWPAVVITIGLGFIFGREKRHCGPWGGPRNPHFRRRMMQRMEAKWGPDWRQKMEQMRQHHENWRDFESNWKRSRYDPGTPTAAGEVIDVNAVFGSVKRTVLSKNFAGGEINAVLGGCEVDFTKADFTGRVMLEVNSVFGGTRIIVPPNWTVVSEMDSVFGSLEDKRPTQLLQPDPTRVLILQGASVFGGTELSVG